MRSFIRYGALAASVLAATACELQVDNPNSPETARVLATANDFEGFLGGYYRRWMQGPYSSLANTWGMMLVQSFENYSSLSNNCLGQRVGIPRAANDNTLGNGCAPEQARMYTYNAEVLRVASSSLATLSASGYSLGATARDARATAFAEFLRGLALGYIAMIYDSSAIVTQATPAQDPGELSGYRAVADSALAAFERAQTSAAGMTAAFPIPATWISSATTLNGPEFIKLIRSYKARIRAGIARTPAERAAVNWDAVIADAQNGITADHQLITSTVNGPSNSWLAQLYTYSTWHQMTPFVIGMGDVSGSYASWIAQPLAERGSGGAFFMVTPDLRFPQGTTRAAQQADFAITSCQAANQVCKRYFVNRPAGNDPAGGNAWGFSNYDHARFYSWYLSGDGSNGARNGPLVFFTKAELDMLQAEGQYRKGNFSAAAALINVTRTRNGLPAITAFDATTPVPGGTECVPKVPVGPTFTTIACGNMFEALKWEKRMETAYTHFGAWWFDSRGWGDLPQGTGLEWATPVSDLQVRGKPIYSLGGGTNPSSAPRGTYGW